MALPIEPNQFDFMLLVLAANLRRPIQWTARGLCMPVQRVELNLFYAVAIHCPFCGQKVIPNQADIGDVNASMDMTPCGHTLFIATDEGWEYRDPRFNENMGLAAQSDGLVDGGYDTFTDHVNLPDAVKFATYDDSPRSFGHYVGFAPIDPE